MRRFVRSWHCAGYISSAGDQLQKDARSWISPPDPSKNHVIARSIHSGKSAVWFTRGRTFKDWDLTGGLLWIHGKRVCFLHHLFQPLMAVRGCSWIREEHPMVSATYTSSSDPIRVETSHLVRASSNRPPRVVTKD